MLAAEAACSSLYSFTLSCVLSANRPAGIPGQPRLCPRERCGQNAHPRQLENRHGIWPKTFTSAEWTKSSMRKYFDISIVVFTICFPQDQLNRNKVPEWQRIAGKAAKEVEKFAKEKADIVLMHWRDKMGIAQKEVRISLPLQKGFTSYVSYKLLRLLTVCSGVFSMRCSSSCWCRTVPQNPEANSITYFAAAASVILHEEQRRLYCRPTSGGNPTCQDVHLISLCLAYLLLKLLFFPFFAVLHSSSVCSLRWLRVTIARSCFKANLCAAHYYLKCVCVWVEVGVRTTLGHCCLLFDVSTNLQSHLLSSKATTSKLTSPKCHGAFSASPSLHFHFEWWWLKMADRLRVLIGLLSLNIPLITSIITCLHHMCNCCSS